MPPLFEELGGQTGGSPAARVDAMNLPRLGFVEQREEVPANPSEGGLENREGEACRGNGIDRVSTLDHHFVSGDRGERVLAGHRELAGEEDPAQNHEAGTQLFPIRTLAAWRLEPEPSGGHRLAHALQDAQRPQRYHLARLARGLQREGLQPVFVLRPPLRQLPRVQIVRVHGIHQPAAVPSPLLLQQRQDLLRPPVVPSPELGDELQPDEDVVVVVIGEVQPVPWVIPRPLTEKAALEVELAAPVYRRLHAPRPLLARIDREGAHPLPSVYDAVPPPAVPAAVRLLVPHQPFEGAPDKSVVGVPELDQRPRGVPREAELARLGVARVEAAVGPSEPVPPHLSRLGQPWELPRDPEV